MPVVAVPVERITDPADMPLHIGSKPEVLDRAKVGERRGVAQAQQDQQRGDTEDHDAPPQDSGAGRLGHVLSTKAFIPTPFGQRRAGGSSPMTITPNAMLVSFPSWPG